MTGKGEGSSFPSVYARVFRTRGTNQVSRILERIEAGAGRPSDLATLENLTRLLPGSGRCGLVDGAATVLASSLSTFGEEYRQALKH